MFCKNCGNEINDSSKFCPNCGSPIEQETVINENAPKPFIDNRNFENPEGSVPQGDATQYNVNDNTQSNRDTCAILSLIFSIASIFLCCLAPFSLIAAIVLGFFGLNSNKRSLAIAGLIISFSLIAIFIIFSVLNIFVLSSMNTTDLFEGFDYFSDYIL